MNVILQRIAQQQSTLQEVRAAAWPLRHADRAEMDRIALNICDNCGESVPNGVNCFIGFNPHVIYCPKCAVALGKWRRC